LLNLDGIERWDDPGGIAWQLLQLVYPLARFNAMIFSQKNLHALGAPRGWEKSGSFSVENGTAGG
jgi:hypothetical protein